MNIHLREKCFYIKSRLFQVWGSYMLFTGIAILVIDITRGTPRSLIYYFSIILTWGLLMALFEMFFFRKVIKANPSDRSEIELRIESLLYKRSEHEEEGRAFFIMSGRTYFMRSVDIMITEAEEALYLNINVFHLRYFKKYKT
jgi:hypothetical protein